VNTPAPKGNGRNGRNGGGLSDRSANVIIGVVTVVWAGNILAGMLQVNGYQPSEAINGIFLTIVGGAFVLRSKTKDE
jgi:hypothetical protein